MEFSMLLSEGLGKFQEKVLSDSINYNHRCSKSALMNYNQQSSFRSWCNLRTLPFHFVIFWTCERQSSVQTVY